MKTIAVIQHVATDGVGFFGTWLEQNAIPYEVFHMYQGATLPSDIRQHSGLCILGGPMSANDPIPYFAQLKEHIREAIAADIPVIGHCLGGQLMSLALGGTVQASENTEIGWSDLQVIHPSGAEWFGADTQLPLFQWHGESFSIPPGATHVVKGKYCANQAYVVGTKHLGMQFHCEVNNFKVTEWLTEVAGAAEMAASNSPGVQSAESVFATLSDDMARSQAIASKIYSRWAQGLVYSTSAAALPEAVAA